MQTVQEAPEDGEMNKAPTRRSTTTSRLSPCIDGYELSSYKNPFDMFLAETSAALLKDTFAIKVPCFVIHISHQVNVMLKSALGFQSEPVPLP